MISRRALVLGSAGLASGGVVGVAGWRTTPYSVKERLGLTPEAFVPDDPEGAVALERVESAAMGGEVRLFTAAPHGYGDGAGLPVVVVLHGASASADQLRAFGLARFVTAAAVAGAPPFVLVGTDDGPAGWVPSVGSDPQAMLRDELPGWLCDRGYDGDRRALWGWSRGGYGALRFAVAEPTWARALALFSPALAGGDPVIDDADDLGDLPVGLWCGEDDGFVGPTRELRDRLPVPPEVATFASGGHTRAFWNDHTLEAFAWLASHLELTAPGS